LYAIDVEWVKWFWGLTCDFWAVFEEKSFEPEKTLVGSELFLYIREEFLFSAMGSLSGHAREKGVGPTSTTSQRSDENS
jgi:hypothetical protein